MSTRIEIKYSELVKQAVIDAFKKLHPRDEIKNLVMFVVWVGSIRTTMFLFLPQQFTSFNIQICVLAVVHLPVRQLCGSDGRRPRQGARRRAAQDAHENDGPQACEGE